MDVLEKIRIRTMTTADLSSVFPIIDRQHWDWLESEVNKILDMDKGYSAVAEFKGSIIGLFTVVANNDLAYWSHLIVEDRFHGRGVGRFLADHVMRSLEETGINDMELFAVPGKSGFYESLGFKKIEPVICLTCESISAEKNKNLVLEPYPAERVLGDSALERALGFNLSRHLGGLLIDRPVLCAKIILKGEFKGLVIANRQNGFTDIGPWIMKAPDEALIRNVLASLVDRLPREDISINVSANNAIAFKVMGNLGFEEDMRLTRMARSSKKIDIYAKNLIGVGKF